MPKSIVYTANQTALTTSSNLLAGDVNEFVPYPALVQVSAVSSATGIRISMFADTDLLIDDKECPYLGTTLIGKDHILDTFQVDAGTRLAIRGRETANVSTTDYYVSVEITPI